MDGTREDIISKIKRWIHDGDSDHPICWLNGPAGFGKSSVSQTIGEYCDSNKLMAAGFFFAREVQHRSTIAHLVPTLAYQLSNFVPATRPFLQQTLGSNPYIVKQSIRHQFQKLMVEPILAVGNPAATPMVIIIDALDECGDNELMAESVDFIINACLENRDFPFRFFLTSRPEKNLQKKLEAFATRSIIYSLDLRNFDASDDIRKFLRSHFFTVQEHTQKLMRGIPRPWPSNSDIEPLVEKAGGSFRRAFEFTKFIDNEAEVGGKAEFRQQRLSFGLSRIIGPLRSSSQQISVARSDSISSISPILQETTPMAAEGSRRTIGVAGSARAERLQTHIFEPAVSNNHSQAEDCFTETTTLEGLIENLILPCAPISFRF
jgi:hypothetical protein